MLQRLILKFALGVIAAVIGIAAIATAVCFLATALANALVIVLGQVYGYFAAGGIILLPFLAAMLVLYVKSRRAPVSAPQSMTHTIARSLFGAIAREAPWIAAGGAAAVAAVEVFLNRRKPRA